MAAQAQRLAYVHSSQFSQPPRRKISRALLALAPRQFRTNRPRLFHFRRLGSHRNGDQTLPPIFGSNAANPAASASSPASRAITAATLGALSVSGNVRRREPFAPMLSRLGPHFAVLLLPLPAGAEISGMQCRLRGRSRALAAARRASKTSPRLFSSRSSGATLGAVAPPEGYVQRIAEICHRHGILLIADEVMTGMGRTGKTFRRPTLGRHPRHDSRRQGHRQRIRAARRSLRWPATSVDAIAQGSGTFLHGFTYNAHPVSAAAGYGSAGLHRQENLLQRVEPAGPRAASTRLRAAAKFSVVGDVRGMGLLYGHRIRARPPRPAHLFRPMPIASRIASGDAARRAW